MDNYVCVQHGSKLPIEWFNDQKIIVWILKRETLDFISHFTVVTVSFHFSFVSSIYINIFPAMD